MATAPEGAPAPAAATAAPADSAIRLVRMLQFGDSMFPVGGFAFSNGLEAAIQKVRLEQGGEEVPDELAAGVAKADEQLFSNLRKALGLDEAVAVNVGAAPTPVEVLEFFHAIGIPIGGHGLPCCCSQRGSRRSPAH